MGLEKIRSLKHKIAVVFVSFVAITVFFSCGKRDMYFSYNEVKDGRWKMHDTLFFVIDSSCYETGIPYNMFLEVTNNVNYPYQNIWFFEWDNTKNDSLFVRNSIEYPLADEFGKWRGTGFGSLYQSTIPLPDVVFHEKRNITVKILHGMQDEVLNGIEKVGIRLSYKK